MGDPQKGEGLQLHRFSPRIEGSELHFKLANLWVLCQEDKLLEHLALKGNGACLGSRRGLCEIGTLLKSRKHAKSHMFWYSGQKQ